MKNFIGVVIAVVFVNVAAASTVQCDFNRNQFSYELTPQGPLAYSRNFGDIEVMISTTQGGIFNLSVTDWSTVPRDQSGTPDSVESSFGLSKMASIRSKMGILSCSVE
jgi:hypothetical protein